MDREKLDEREFYSLTGLNQINNNERQSEQAHIPHAPTLLENDVYNEWQFQALENQFHPSCTK